MNFHTRQVQNAADSIKSSQRIGRYGAAIALLKEMALGLYSHRVKKSIHGPSILLYSRTRKSNQDIKIGCRSVSMITKNFQPLIDLVACSQDAPCL